LFIVDSEGILKGEKPLKEHNGNLFVIVAYKESGGPKKLFVFSQLVQLFMLVAKCSAVKVAWAGFTMPKKSNKETIIMFNLLFIFR